MLGSAVVETRDFAFPSHTAAHLCSALAWSKASDDRVKPNAALTCDHGNGQLGVQRKSAARKPIGGNRQGLTYGLKKKGRLSCGAAWPLRARSPHPRWCDQCPDASLSLAGNAASHSSIDRRAGFVSRHGHGKPASSCFLGLRKIKTAFRSHLSSGCFSNGNSSWASAHDPLNMPRSGQGEARVWPGRSIRLALPTSSDGPYAGCACQSFRGRPRPVELRTGPLQP